MISRNNHQGIIYKTCGRKIIYELANLMIKIIKFVIIRI